MSAFKHSAVGFGTPDMSPTSWGRSIGPISLHNAIGQRRAPCREGGAPSLAFPPCPVVGRRDAASEILPYSPHPIVQELEAFEFPPLEKSLALLLRREMGIRQLGHRRNHVHDVRLRTGAASQLDRSHGRGHLLRTVDR